MTLVQKFQTNDDEEYPLLSDAENIIVLVDESHRSQYSSLAMNMRIGLPNATYIGFTGTPIDKEDKSTVRTFGTYIDKYPIEQAVLVVNCLYSMKQDCDNVKVKRLILCLIVI